MQKISFCKHLIKGTASIAIGQWEPALPAIKLRATSRE